MSLLEQTITAQGDLCVFLPKFHCELNLIEMVHIFSYHAQLSLIPKITQYWGWCKGRYREVYSRMQRRLPSNISMLAQSRLSDGSSTSPGGSWMPISMV